MIKRPSRVKWEILFCCKECKIIEMSQPAQQKVARAMINYLIPFDFVHQSFKTLIKFEQSLTKYISISYEVIKCLIKASITIFYFFHYTDNRLLWISQSPNTIWSQRSLKIMKESVKQNHSTDFKELKLAVTESTLPPCCKVLDFYKVQHLQRFCMIVYALMKDWPGIFKTLGTKTISVYLTMNFFVTDWDLYLNVYWLTNHCSWG